SELRYRRLHVRRARRYEYCHPWPQVRRRVYRHGVTQSAPALVSPDRCAGSLWPHDVRWLVFAFSDHARPHVAKWLCAGYRRCVAVQRGRRQGLVRGRPSAGRQRFDWPHMGLVTRYRPGDPSFVEWHHRRRWIPYGRLSLPADWHYGTHHRRLAQRAELQPGIRPPAAWLAENTRLAIGRRGCTGDTDCTRVHDPGVLRYFVRSGVRMGAACTCEIPDDQAVVGGA